MSEKCACHIRLKDGTRVAVKDAEARARIEELEANSGGGSAKLYKHRVCLSSIYNEETWMEDPSFTFYITFYRSTATPVTSFDEIQNHELMLEKMKWFTEWDAPEANRTAIALGKSNSGKLIVEYIYSMNEYESVVLETSEVEFSPDQFTITDTVYEV